MLMLEKDDLWTLGSDWPPLSRGSSQLMNLSCCTMYKYRQKVSLPILRLLSTLCRPSMFYQYFRLSFQVQH